MFTNKWAQSGEEPSLKDIMNDPIVGLIMARDKLQPQDVWKVVNDAKAVIEQRAA